MAGYNKIIMVGNLTRDPDLRTVGTQSVCKLNIASNRQYKNKQNGSLVQEVCFIDVEVWGSQADSCKLYLQKGKSILVEGRLKLDSWKDTDGNARSKHSIGAERIVFLGTASSEHGEEREDLIPHEEKKEGKRKSAASSSQKEKTTDVFSDIASFAEDELPF